MSMPKPKLHIDGLAFSTLEGFFDHVSSRLVPGVPWARNLDPFSDILRVASARRRKASFSAGKTTKSPNGVLGMKKRLGSYGNGWSDVIQIMWLQPKRSLLPR
jgi:hypothetical protein